jgi:predicted MPP superfamily phosphohydrolase
MASTDDPPPDFRATSPALAGGRKKTSRRFWLRAALGLGAAGVGAAGYVRYWESGWLRISSHSLPPEKFHVEKKLRFLHLSDFHASDVVPFELMEEAVQLGLSQNPDAAFLTGDFITTKLTDAEFERLTKILRELSAKTPTFACLGNHDGGKWAASTYGYETSQKVEDALAGAGVYLLRNQRENIFIKGQKMTVAGVGDLWSDEMKPAGVLRPLTGKESTTARPPIILLSHNPDSKEELASYDWDLMLCGHTHGGQCILPLLGTPFAPVEDHRFVEGLHHWQDRLIHITRGVGNLHGLRFNCRPEVSFLEAGPAPPPEED